jgi:hypothetical protein
MAFTRTELLPFRCPTCEHCAHLAKRAVRLSRVGPPPPYVCQRCGNHAVPENLLWIAAASLLFFAVAAMGLSFLTSVFSLGRDSAFFLDVFLSVAFFQLLAHRIIAWRPVSHGDPAARESSSASSSDD